MTEQKVATALAKLSTTLAKTSSTVDSEHETLTQRALLRHDESTASVVNDTGKNNAHSYESGEPTTTTKPAAAAAQEKLNHHSISESQDTAHLGQEFPLSSISLQMKKRGAHQLVRRDRSNVANQHLDNDNDASDDKVKSRGAALGDSALRKL